MKLIIVLSKKKFKLIPLFFLCFQGAKDLAKPPTLTDIFHSNLKNSESKEEDSTRQQHQEENKKGVKRKFDSNESSDDHGHDFQKEIIPSPKDKKMNKAKNVGFLFSLFCCITLLQVSLRNFSVLLFV